MPEVTDVMLLQELSEKFDTFIVLCRFIFITVLIFYFRWEMKGGAFKR